MDFAYWFHKYFRDETRFGLCGWRKQNKAKDDCFWFSMFAFACGLIYLIFSKQPWLALTYCVLCVVCFRFVFRFRVVAAIGLAGCAFALYGFAFSLLGLRDFTLKALTDMIPGPLNPRTALVEWLKATGDRKVAGTVLLLVFNERTEWIDGLYRQLIDIGILHLAVVSGLHLNLIYFLIKKAFRGRETASDCVGFAVVAAYAYFLNLSFGIVRVVLTIVINAILRRRGRRRDLLSVTCRAGLVTLLINPHAVFSLNFELSYLALVGICLARGAKSVDRWCLGIVTAFTINLLTGPIVLSINRKIHLLTLFNSWVLTPVLMFYYLLSLAICFLPFSFGAMNFAYDLLFDAVAGFSGVRLFLHLDVRQINAAWAFAYYVAFVGVFYVAQFRGQSANKNLKYPFRLRHP